MIWLTWRQHRGQLLVAIGALAAFGVVLVLTGLQMRSAFRDSGLGACLARIDLSRPLAQPGGGCRDLAAAFASRFFNYRLLGLIAFTVVPLGFGVFWGAPVVAGELERGTHQLIWTQGVTRTRWAVVKLACLSVAVLALAGTVVVVTDWWMEPLNRATGERFVWLIFDQQGLVPLGYALFAFALGALGGAITRRTQRGVALMIIVFLAIRFAVAVELRPHYLPEQERTYPVIGTGGPNRLAGDWIVGGGGPGVGAFTPPTGRRSRAVKPCAGATSRTSAGRTWGPARITSRSTSPRTGSGCSRGSRRRSSWRSRASRSARHSSGFDAASREAVVARGTDGRNDVRRHRVPSDPWCV